MYVNNIFIAIIVTAIFIHMYTLEGCSMRFSTFVVLVLVNDSRNYEKILSPLNAIFDIELRVNLCNSQKKQPNVIYMYAYFYDFFSHV